MSIAPATPAEVEANPLDRAAAAVRHRREWEIEEIQTAIEHAHSHGHPQTDTTGRRDPMSQPGGEGTPPVRQYAIGDLGCARQTHANAARAIIADGLDLVHRLPQIWRVLNNGQGEPWVAKRVARLTRHLPVDLCHVVDGPVAELMAGAQPPSTVLETAEAKIIEADPDRHAEQVEDARRGRYVALSQSDEDGYRRIIANITAGDATMVDAVIDRVADILIARHAPTEGAEEVSRDEWRGEAFGYLARPADLLRLLLEHTELDVVESDESVDGPTAPAYAPEHTARTVERLHHLPASKLAALLPKTTLFAHIDAEAAADGTGVIRVEGHGPMGISTIGTYLNGSHVTVVPVIDLNGAHLRADAYETPEAVKDRAWLTSGGDVFPYSTRRQTRGSVDFDHIKPYDPGGPPGQTGTHNCAPLSRRHHRWKTHAGYRYLPVGGRRHLWRTPASKTHLTSPRGTETLAAWQTDLIEQNPEIEVYFGDLEVNDSYATRGKQQE